MGACVLLRSATGSRHNDLAVTTMAVNNKGQMIKITISGGAKTGKSKILSLIARCLSRGGCDVTPKADYRGPDEVEGLCVHLQEEHTGEPVNNGNKSSECILVTADSTGRPAAILVGDRAEADAMAKERSEQCGEEIAVYQYVGTWKPKTVPVEFVPSSQLDSEKYVDPRQPGHIQAEADEEARAVRRTEPSPVRRGDMRPPRES